MEREILFRGKRVEGGGWIEGYYTKCHKSGNCYITTQSVAGGAHPWRVEPETVGQFTGLLDRNGVKIFEGDIVKYQFDNDDCPFPDKKTDKIVGRIFFSDWRASFSVTAGKGGSDMMNNNLFNYIRNGNRVEVIGNIHDTQPSERCEGGEVADD